MAASLHGFAIAFIALIATTTTYTLAFSMTSAGTGKGIALRQLAQDAAKKDATGTLDLSGILWTEHINLVVGSKEQAEQFYLEFLGFTRDAGRSFHVNLGQQQFHLAENGDPAQKITGSIGLVVPTLDSVRGRVKAAEEVLKGTQFTILSDDEENGCMTLLCPWGNRMHIYAVDDDVLQSSLETPQKMTNLHAQGGGYGAHRMAVRGNPGIRYIEVSCPQGKSTSVATFYREMLGCTVSQTMVEGSEAAVVCVGPGLHLAFVEDQNLTEADTAAQLGVHLCIYASDFEGLYNRLSQRNLIWTNPRFVHLDTCDTWEEASASRTLRFKDIIDLETGEKILELEHETRSLRHGQYLKVPLYEPK